jgi:AcrR family transcriptional regulator
MAASKTKPIQPLPQDDSRQRIIAGARKHFFAHGFRGVTMDDLARELGMSKKTLYAHFDSKPALVEAVIQSKLDQAASELAAIETKYEGDFESTLREFLATLHRHAGELAPAYVRDMKSAAPELWAKVESRRAAVIERYFGKLFRDGRKAGLIRGDVPPKLILEVMLGLIQVVLNPQTVTQLNLTPQSALTHTLSIILNGVFATDKAPKR